jgi:predicted nucleic acid-binding Zn ribbon protein
VSEEHSEARATYLRFRQIFGDPSRRSTQDSRRRERTGESVPYGRGREPKGVGDVLDALTMELGWNSPLARATLLSDWPEICGPETAQHSEPVGIEEGVLTVQCDSTAWATQLRLMRSEVVGQITSRFPDAGVSEVRFLAPNAPSWKRGPRAIPGRGPRDTYG